MSNLARITCVLTLMMTGLPASAAQVRDVGFFLQRLQTLDHLPEMEDGHTALASTWDRAGGNEDGTDFKRIEGNRNILLDVDGPGCLHRLFVGRLGDEVAGTRIQVFLDGAASPLFDMPVDEFFADEGGPFLYPLVFHKTYPGTLFPFPFEKHCLVQLVSDRPEKKWGRFWQLTYTRYPADAGVRTLAWPLSDAQQAQMRSVCDAWLRAESNPPQLPRQGVQIHRREMLKPGEQWEIKLAEGTGVIRQMWPYIFWPRSLRLYRNLRVQIFWDNTDRPSVDVPFAYLFGEVDEFKKPETRFNSLLMGTTPDEAYFCLPMPYSAGARMVLINQSRETAEGLRLAVAAETLPQLPANYGRLHATFHQARADLPDGPRCGPQKVPVHNVLEVPGPGKYVGTLLSVDWPSDTWWGEGDWLIWTDEDAWPPSYHGTGSEEYFNSGWCKFDRKAVSGFIQTSPGESVVYTFHLNDAFQFRRNIRVVEEQMCFKKSKKFLEDNHPAWSSTAFWYATPARPAGSTPATSQPQ